MGGYQLVRRVIGLGSRHPLQIAFLRIAIGIYLVILTAVLYSAGVRDAWPWVTGVSALVHFILAARLLRIAKRHGEVNASPR